MGSGNASDGSEGSEAKESSERSNAFDVAIASYNGVTDILAGELDEKIDEQHNDLNKDKSFRLVF